MYLISKAHRGQECEWELEELFRLRYRVFKERLGWDVECHNGMERDRFDDLDPVNLALRGPTGFIEGCVRLLPTTGPNMLRDVFPTLLDGEPAPCSPHIWESSRFSLDAKSTEKSQVGLTWGTHELFAGMIEFGLSWRLSHIVTVTDRRVQRILKRGGWPLEPLGTMQRIGDTNTLAGFLEISEEALDRVCEIGELKRPVLWVPAQLAA